MFRDCFSFHAQWWFCWHLGERPGHWWMPDSEGHSRERFGPQQQSAGLEGPSREAGWTLPAYLVLSTTCTWLTYRILPAVVCPTKLMRRRNSAVLGVESWWDCEGDSGTGTHDRICTDAGEGQAVTKWVSPSVSSLPLPGDTLHCFRTLESSACEKNPTCHACLQNWAK